jgi:hypothetical protein
MKPPRVYPCDKKASCGCGQTDVTVTSSSVVGGENAIAHSWPMMVSIQHNNKHVCGGTILSDSFILSAAECLYYFNHSNYNLTINVGIHKLSETVTVTRKVKKIYVHPDNSDTWQPLHDIAIAHLDNPIPFDHSPSVFAKTCVPIKSEVPAREYLEPHAELVVIGWGGSNLVRPFDTLRQISVRLINSSDELCTTSIIDDTYQFCADPSNTDDSVKKRSLCRGKKN